MYKVEITDRIYRTGIMAIVRVETNERAEEIATACINGGVDVLEISFTNNNASQVIAYLDKTFGDNILVGAGTVLDSQTARIAILTGAKFIIAPTFNREVAVMCNRYQIPYAPGCSTYSEMVEALEYGAAFVKVFPVANYFGPGFVSVLKTPLPNMPILSSGGVTKDNVHEWFVHQVDCIGVGSLLTKGSKEEIEENARFLCQARDQYRK